MAQKKLKNDEEREQQPGPKSYSQRPQQPQPTVTDADLTKLCMNGYVYPLCRGVCDSNLVNGTIGLSLQWKNAKLKGKKYESVSCDGGEYLGIDTNCDKLDGQPNDTPLFSCSEGCDTDLCIDCVEALTVKVLSEILGSSELVPYWLNMVRSEEARYRKETRNAENEGYYGIMSRQKFMVWLECVTQKRKRDLMASRPRNIEQDDDKTDD